MNFGTDLQFVCPDDCPSECGFATDGKPSFNGFCSRCPVFLCKESETAEDKLYLPVVEPNSYRDDWAVEWINFFETGKFPSLYI